MAEVDTGFNEMTDRSWADISTSFKPLAESIERQSLDHSRQLRRRARRVSKSLRNQISFAEAIKVPDIVAFLFPLLTEKSTQEILEPRLEAVARVGLCSLYSQPSSLQNFLRLMIYPLVLASAALTLFLGFAFYIAPEFEQMFAEFGILLPSATVIVIEAARMVRDSAFLVTILGLIVCGVAVLATLTPLRTILGLDKLLGLFQNRRHALAAVALHTYQLRCLGLSATSAFKIAMDASGSVQMNAKLRERTELNGDENFETDFILSDTPSYRLLAFAIQQPATPAYDAMLWEAADYYRRAIVTISDWWVRWMVLAFQWLVMLLVLFVIAALFMPLVSILGGLTG